VKSVVDAHQKLLETFKSPTFADRDYARVEDNVAYLSQKKVTSAE
jgi:cell division initiation protein